MQNKKESPKRNSPQMKEIEKDSPKKESSGNKNFLKNIFNQDGDGYIRMSFILITICVFAICLTLYLCGYGDAQQAILQNNNFTSSFLYKVWFVVPLLCIAFVCVLIVIQNIKVFNLYVTILLLAVFVLFGWTFALVYYVIPNKSSKTAQVMSFVTIGLTGLLAVLIMYVSHRPIVSLILMLPIFFFEAIFIYVGGVQVGEWQNF